MHPQNPYRIPPDFGQLAEAYPPLEPCIISQSGKFSIDFKNESSQRCGSPNENRLQFIVGRRLTEALLHRDFDISLNLPMNRLCPPVPNRLNYVLWIQDIIRTTDLQGRPLLGIDIGTGASAIYPLLFCRLNPNWSFIATDVDKLSLNSARSNIEQNGFTERVQVFETTPEAPIFAPLHEDPSVKADFTMCNPPFYSSHEDVAASADSKEFEPNAVCTGADIEMITEGGESSFVRRMVDESIENYGITEFIQGSTRRWAVVWSFSDFRLSDRGSRLPVTELMPPRNTLRFPALNTERLTETLSTVLAAVDGIRVVHLEPSGDIGSHRFTIFATKNTWSRAARRKNKHTPQDAEACQWIQGRDRTLFEGFASHISRKVSEVAQH
ncbi:S-adenosyl-L-methionine dependent methyltransferase [Mycena leptocephala]|nr:S-adenosyl-L-methionine dependent methyltransferase [Mycena leptocephala]